MLKLKKKVWQRFAVRVTKTYDEKFARIVHGKAGAGSKKACICCNLSREVCKNEANFGTKEVTNSIELEEEAIKWCMDNPLGWTREKLEEFAFGVKSKPITKTEPVEEIPDNLHLKINVATHIELRLD